MLAALLRHRTTPLLLRSVGSAALPLAMPPAARGPSTPRSEHGFAPARMPPLRQLLPHRRLGGLSSLHTAAERPLIDPAEADDRLQRLQSLITRHQQEIQRAMVGRELSVLVEKAGREAGQMVGKSEYLHSVHIDACPAQVGDIVRVRVVDSKSNSLTARQI